MVLDPMLQIIFKKIPFVEFSGASQIVDKICEKATENITTYLCEAGFLHIFQPK